MIELGMARRGAEDAEKICPQISLNTLINTFASFLRHQRNLRAIVFINL